MYDLDYGVYFGIKIAVAIIMAVFLGNGAVVLFNRVPVHWFEDEGELPPGLNEMGDGSRQRITSTPWKYVFVALLGICGVYLAWSNSLQYEITALIILFIALEIAIADMKYHVVPDQFNILLAMSAVGFIGYYEEWYEQLLGAVFGLAILLIVYLLGKAVTKSDAIGGADVKYFAAMGLATGRSGVIFIFLLTNLLIALHAFILLFTDKDALKEPKPMLAYAMAAAVVYFVFFYNVNLTQMLFN